MKRSQLSEIIKSTVARRLQEIAPIDYGTSPRQPKNNDPKYAYVVGQITNDPTVQVVGYGRMRLSQLKKLVADHAEEAAKKAKEGRFDQVQHLVKSDGMLPFFTNAAAEVQAALAKSLQEIAPTNMFGVPTQQPSTMPKNNDRNQSSDEVEGMSDQDKRALEDAQKNQQKLSNDRDRLKGAIQKLQEPVRRKIADAERKVAAIEQKLGVATNKIQNIEKKYQKGRWTETIKK